MKRTLWILAVLMLCFAVPAYAGVGDVFSKVWRYIGGSAPALALSAILAIGGIGAVTVRYTPIFGAVGRLLIAFEIAFADKKISKEELEDLWKKLKEIRTAIGKVK